MARPESALAHASDASGKDNILYSQGRDARHNFMLAVPSPL